MHERQRVKAGPFGPLPDNLVTGDYVRRWRRQLLRRNAPRPGGILGSSCPAIRWAMGYSQGAHGSYSNVAC
ncbi:MAG: hypothetical protein E5V18_13640 [Mesorhizobium sp.]|nr:MAG: hypothetical protein E5V18_13640 [Mesorhizobium sp.]